MESSKHNDELIKRKLDSLSIEPRKLKFAEVKANYDKAKDASSNKWGLFFIFGSIGIAALVGAYLLLTPRASDQIAANGVSTQNTPEQTIQSVGTTSEDKFIERSEKTSLELTTTNSEQASLQETNTSANTGNETVSKDADPTSEVNATSSSATKKATNSSSTTHTKKNENASANTLNKKQSNASGAKNNILTNSSGQTKIAASVNKTEVKKQVQTTANTQPLTNSDVFNTTGGQNLPADKAGKNTDTQSNDTKDETTKNYQGNTDQSSLTKQGSSDQNNNGNTNNANSEGKNESSTDQIAKTDTVSNNNAFAAKVDSANDAVHIPGIIGTGSVSPRNKHKFLIGAEFS